MTYLIGLGFVIVVLHLMIIAAVLVSINTKLNSLSILAENKAVKQIVDDDTLISINKAVTGTYELLHDRYSE